MKITVAIAILLLTTSLALGQEATKEVVVDGLKNPCGVAIQPSTGHAFVADSGNFKIVRVVDGKSQDVITHFPQGVYENGQKYNLGPLGLLFLDPHTLVVGEGGKPGGQDTLRVFKVPAVDADPITADTTLARFSLPALDQAPGEGNFYGIAKTASAVYVTCNGDDDKGWIAQADLTTNQLTNFRRQIATRESVKVNSPTAISISPEGFLAVGQIGKTDAGTDSQLTFYEQDGMFLQNFETGLKDMVGMAYGPKRGRLFVVDFHFEDSDSGGLFKIVADGKDKCKPVKIMALDKPSAMAFAPNGDLYVTQFGSPEATTDQPTGSLIRVKGLDQEPKQK